MTASANRTSSYTAGSGDIDCRNGDSKNLWTSMLESVSDSKRLPEKNLIVLGATPESQRDFLDAVSSPESRRNVQRQKVPPVANQFALGNSYYDVLETDQDDILARVSLYLLSHPSAEFASLISPLITPQTILNTAIVILLDWNQPHLWLRQLWSWIKVIEAVMSQASLETQNMAEESMKSWVERGRGGGSINLDGTSSATAGSVDEDSSLPLGPGEWTEPLGLPLCVVCQNAQRMEYLEKQNNWKEADFDAVLQYLRTVLLRHGASLIYTSQNSPSQLATLIHSTLGITSLLKRKPLKANVIDRERIVVPPNYDSWGKIRVLGTTLDCEVISREWAEDIKLPPESTPPSLEELEKERAEDGDSPEASQVESAVSRYEDWCREPTTAGLPNVAQATLDDTVIGVESDDTQSFLERQLKILEAYRSKVPNVAIENTTGAVSSRSDGLMDNGVNEHIGPVQFNMGGIQVDADDMLQRLKDRNAASSQEEPTTSDIEEASPNIADKYDTDQLQNFFSGLMNRKAGATDSPR